ncbi:hypothetical protein JCM10450v2_004350 [Rhodotorula kratochvilovae]
MASVSTAFDEFDALYKRAGPWWRNKGLLSLNLALFTVFITQLNNGYDSALISGYQALEPWRADLDYPSPSKIGFLNLISYCAGLATAPIAAFASDRWGRRLCIRYAAFTMVVGSVMGSVAGEGNASPYGLFLASRAVIGSGLAFAVIISPILLQELPHPSQRQTLASLFNSCYLFGSIIAAWTIFGTGAMTTSWSWRIPYIIQIGPALFALVSIFFVPESPRFHLGRGDEQACFDFLVKYHGNGEETELVRFEFEEMKETLQKEKEATQYGWAILWATPANRRRLALVLWIGFCQCLSGQAIITFYYTNILKLVGLTETRQVTGINGGLQILNWLASLLGVYLVPRIPRRNLLISAWVGVLISNIWLIVSSAMYAKDGRESAGIAAVVAVWLYDFFYNILCGPLFFSYTAEVLPFNMRAKGTVLIVIQICGWYVLAVNTNGLTLEEVALLFEPNGGAIPDVEHAAAVALRSRTADTVGKYDDESVEGPPVRAFGSGARK